MADPQSVSPDKVDASFLDRERRVWVRCSCNLDSSCQPVALPSAPQLEVPWYAKVRDLSVGGLNLHLRRRFEPGTTLLIEVPIAAERTNKTLAAVVVHVAKGPEGWIHGCRFEARLTQDELVELL
jgi:hypothetical protein